MLNNNVHGIINNRARPKLRNIIDSYALTFPSKRIKKAT